MFDKESQLGKNSEITSLHFRASMKLRIQPPTLANCLTITDISDYIKRGLHE